MNNKILYYNMEEKPKIKIIQNEIIQLENIIEEILIIEKPELVPPVDYCFGIINLIVNYILTWYYKC